MKVYRFRDCLLNTAERAVIKDNEHIELTSRTLDLLQYLIENAGIAVTKDDILGKVWGGHFVEESNLPVHISKLRRSLGENRGNRFIETVQGVGYRFVAPVQEVPRLEWDETSKNAKPYKNGNSGVGPILNSIAVLPLENESGDQNIDYLVDGLTEGLINGLSHIPGLKVIARNTVFRYKNRDVNLKELGELLGVSRIITGRVRLVGENIVVGVELIIAADGVQIWGEQYNKPFDQIVQVQKEIIAVIETRLATAGSLRNAGSLTETENADSYRLYLMGTYLLRKRTEPEILKAIEYFQKSVSSCATNVHSNVGIAEALYLLYAFDLASRAETLNALAPILDALSEGNEALDVVQELYGRLKLTLHWNADSAEHHLKAALSLNPNSSAAHARLASILVVQGKEQEAVFHADQVVALDPVSMDSLRQLGRVYYMLGQYENSVAFLSDAYEMEPQDAETRLLLGAALAELGEYSKAIDLTQVSFQNHHYIEALSMTGYIHALWNQLDKAKEMIVRIESQSRSGKSHPLSLARIYLALGEKEAAYELLELAYEERSVDLFGLTIDPRWQKIRSESRFQDLVRRVHRASGSTGSENLSSFG